MTINHKEREKIIEELKKSYDPKLNKFSDEFLEKFKQKCLKEEKEYLNATKLHRRLPPISAEEVYRNAFIRIMMDETLSEFEKEIKIHCMCILL